MAVITRAYEKYKDFMATLSSKVSEVIKKEAVQHRISLEYLRFTEIKIVRIITKVKRYARTREGIEQKSSKLLE